MSSPRWSDLRVFESAVGPTTWIYSIHCGERQHGVPPPKSSHFGMCRQSQPMRVRARMRQRLEWISQLPLRSLRVSPGIRDPEAAQTQMPRTHLRGQEAPSIWLGKSSLMLSSLLQLHTHLLSSHIDPCPECVLNLYTVITLIQATPIAAPSTNCFCFMLQSLMEEWSFSYADLIVVTLQFKATNCLSFP